MNRGMDFTASIPAVGVHFSALKLLNIKALSIYTISADSAVCAVSAVSAVCAVSTVSAVGAVNFIVVGNHAMPVVAAVILVMITLLLLLLRVLRVSVTDSITA